MELWNDKIFVVKSWKVEDIEQDHCWNRIIEYSELKLKKLKKN